MSEANRQQPEYTVTTCNPGDLSEAELAACVSIINEGGAVAADVAKLKRAQLLAVVRDSDEIVGVGSIKRVRPEYASTIGVRSGFSFTPQTPELGYVAVARGHRRRGLSVMIVGALVGAKEGGFFATTYDDRMKKTLAGAGFVQKGNEWMGRTERLSLWMKN